MAAPTPAPANTPERPAGPGFALVPATPALVDTKLRDILQRHPSARRVAIAAGGPWTGPSSLVVGGRDVRIAWCPSPLAVREVLAGGTPEGETVAILTPVAEGDLGADVLARLLRNRVFPLDRWQLLETMFGAHGVDPRVVDAPGLVDALIELVPPGGYPPVASGMLDLATAWSAIVTRVLGVGDVGDLVALLDAVRTPERQGAWAGLDPTVRRGVCAWLGERAGGAAAGIVGTLDPSSGDPVDAAAVGLVCGVVLTEPSSEPSPSAAEAPGDQGVLARAAVRLEPMTGGLAPGDPAARAWSDAAQRYCGALGMGAEPIYQRAQALLDTVGAAAAAHRSDVLPSGFAQRLDRAAHALDAVLDDPSAERLARLAGAAAAVTHHQLAARQPARVEAVRMAVRLARAHAERPAAADSFAAAARRYADEGSWADWAYARVWGAESEPRLAAAFERLLAVTADERAAAGRAFAESLAGWAPTGGGDVLLIEDVLERVVAPVAEAGQGVLLVVLDGMSAPAAAELFGDMATAGWTEVVPPTGRAPVIAAFPTVTKVCRTSLLSGRLAEGDAHAERKGLAAHPRLSAASSPSRPPVLFHKPDLAGPGGRGLAAPPADAIADPKQRVVGVVVNAIDDHLAKGDQVAVPWTIDHVRPLGPLLELAATSGRVVVLTADHGHVVERGMELRTGGEGERWRSDDGQPADDEVVLAGPRVVLGGGRIIAPWSDGVRYDRKKHGYHGGASPAEVVVPLGVFVAALDGWEPAPPRGPAWWDDTATIAPAAETATEAAAAAPTRPTRRRRPSSQEGASDELFPETGRAAETVDDEGPSAPAAPAWIADLFDTEVYAAQESRAGRVALARPRVAAMLEALAGRGGTLTHAALARAADIPATRLAGTLSGLVRLLNVDGYAVVTLGDDEVTLDRAMLDQQFGLGSSRTDGRGRGSGSRQR